MPLPYIFSSSIRLMTAVLIAAGLLIASVGAVHAAEKSDNKKWSKDEVRAFKKQMKKEYPVFIRAHDFWSALQYKAWLNSQQIPVKLSTPLARAYTGNPLYAFPNNISSYYNHGDSVTVATRQRLHFINIDGKPLKPSFRLPFQSDQTALSDNGKFLASMGVRTRSTARGAPPIIQWRIHTINLEKRENIFNSSWMVIPYVIEENTSRIGRIAHDGSAAALRIRGVPRVQDEIIVARTKGQPLFYKKIRRCVVLGENGEWMIGRESTGKLYRYQSGEKTIPLRAAVASHGCAATMSPSSTDAPSTVSIIYQKNTWSTLDIALGDNPRLYAFDTWLVVDAGIQLIAEDDVIDIMGTVLEKGKTRSQHLSYAYKWADLRAGILDAAFTITGSVQPSTMHHDHLIGYDKRTVTYYDFSQADMTSTDVQTFSSDIDTCTSQGAGISIACTDQSRHLLDHTGKIIWHGTGGRTFMCGIDTMAHYQDNSVDLIRFLADGSTHSTHVPLPRTNLTYEIHCSLNDHRVHLQADERNWLDVNQDSDDTIIDGHVDDNADLIRPPYMSIITTPSRGRFHIFGARLFPKWIRTAPSFDQSFAPMDAMYTRLGVMVIDSHRQLHRLNKSFEHKATYPDFNVTWCQFTVQSKDPVTYITRWRDGDHHTKHIIDRNGKLRTPRKDFIPKRQHPEGDWRVEWDRFTIPRRGSIRWPIDQIGFAQRKLRSRSGNKNLLVLTRSLLIELDPASIKRIFPR